MYIDRYKNLSTKKKKRKRKKKGKIYKSYIPRVPLLHKTVIITMMELCGHLYPNPVIND